MHRWSAQLALFVLAVSSPTACQSQPDCLSYGLPVITTGVQYQNPIDLSHVQLLGVGFVIAGSVQLAMSPLFLIPSPLEKIRDPEMLFRNVFENPVSWLLALSLYASHTRSCSRPNQV